eukprot:TRINITY_DN19996_c0_g1_i1.p1 TRINITY_DN19996_c0_g1~~TRINITY_DN19996_c0_g1_i1.p1  ORF type:complete len:104 (+),score=5.67 TRINITY_DN19996_c0_g1_i1:162-473(+)
MFVKLGKMLFAQCKRHRLSSAAAAASLNFIGRSSTYLETLELLSVVCVSRELKRHAHHAVFQHMRNTCLARTMKYVFLAQRTIVNSVSTSLRVLGTHSRAKSF